MIMFTFQKVIVWVMADRIPAEDVAEADLAVLRSQRATLLQAEN